MEHLPVKMTKVVDVGIKGSKSAPSISL